MTVVDVQHDRFWALEGCSNFRDLGGYRTATGAATRWRTLFRSDSLAAASPADRVALRQCGLKTVIDLRADHETALGGRFDDAGLAYHHLPLGDLFAMDSNWDAWADPSYVADRYFELCETGGTMIGEALAVLTDPAAYPAVIHCSVGKDRTGVLVALIQRAVGITVEDVVTEYALSARGAQLLVDRLRARIGPVHADDLAPYLPALLAADPEAMRRFLRRLYDEFGSVRDYLRHLGVESSIDYLRAALLQ